MGWKWHRHSASLSRYEYDSGQKAADVDSELSNSCSVREIISNAGLGEELKNLVASEGLAVYARLD